MPIVTESGLKKIRAFNECLKELKSIVDTVGFSGNHYRFVARSVTPEKAIISDNRLCYLCVVDNQIVFRTSLGTGTINAGDLDYSAAEWEAIVAAIQQPTDSAAEMNSEINLSPEQRKALVTLSSLKKHVDISLGVLSQNEASPYSHRTLDELISLFEELINNNDVNYWNNNQRQSRVFHFIEHFTGGIGHYSPVCFDLLSYEIGKKYQDFLKTIRLSEDFVLKSVLIKQIFGNLDKIIDSIGDNTEQQVRLFEIALFENRRKLIEPMVNLNITDSYNKWGEIDQFMGTTKRLLTCIEILGHSSRLDSQTTRFLRISYDAYPGEMGLLVEYNDGQQYTELFSGDKSVKQFWPAICAAIIDEKVTKEDKNFLMGLIKEEYAKFYALDTVVECWSPFFLSVDDIMRQYAERIGPLMTALLNDCSLPERTIENINLIIGTEPFKLPGDLRVTTGQKDYMIGGLLAEEKALLQNVQKLGGRFTQPIILTRVRENFDSAKEEYGRLIQALFDTIQAIKKDFSEYKTKRSSVMSQFFRTTEKYKMAEEIITHIDEILAKSEASNICGEAHPPFFKDYLNDLLCLFLQESAKHGQILQEKDNISHGKLGVVITATLNKLYDLLDKISFKCNPEVFYPYLSSLERNQCSIRTLDDLMITRKQNSKSLF